MKNLLLLLILTLFLRIPLLSQTMQSDPDLWIPDTIPVALGNSIELYNNNIAFVKLNDKNINFKWKSKVGSSDSLKWSWTAEQTGKFNLTMNCFFKDSLINSVHTTLKVVPKARISPKNLLAIGNSLTQGGFEYLFAQVSRELDFELNPIGTRGSKVKHEGHGGWLFESFLNSKSPFFMDSCLSFKKYIVQNNLPNPDIIRISLGINDCYLNSSHPLDLIMRNAASLIDTIYKDYPNSVFIIALPSTCESTGSGWLSSYKNLANFEPYQLHMRGLWKRIYAKFGEGRYKPNIMVSYDGLCIDRNNGYPQNNGVHPNPKGYAQLATGFSNTLNDYIVRMKE